MSFLSAVFSRRATATSGAAASRPTLVRQLSSGALAPDAEATSLGRIRAGEQGPPGAALRSGFSILEIELLLEVAKNHGVFLFVRPCNPISNIIKMMAMLQGEGIVLKNMEVKAKSTELGGGSIPESSPPEAAHAGAGHEHVPEETDPIKIQKGKYLEYAPAQVSLDILHFLIAVSRLEGGVTLRREKVKIKAEDGSAEKEEVRYYLQYRFNKIFRSSKTSEIRVQIPEVWVHPSLRGDDSSTTRSNFQQARGEITELHFAHRMVELEAVNAVLIHAAQEPAAGIQTKGLASYPPSDLFVLQKSNLDEDALDAEWKRLFKAFSELRELFADECFIAGTDELKPHIQSAWLTMHASVTSRDKTKSTSRVRIDPHPTLPWPVQQAYRMINGVRHWLSSDMDLALIAHHREELLPVMLDMSKAWGNKGRVTGIGSPEDCQIICAINEIYLEMLARKIEAAGPEAHDIETEFYRRQLRSQIIQAHHGAENLRPWKRAEAVDAKASFDEGFFCITPHGHLEFLEGVPAITARLTEITARGYKAPISSVWHYLMASYATPWPEGLLVQYVDHLLQAGRPSRGLTSLTRAPVASARHLVRRRRSVITGTAPEGSFVPLSGLTEGDAASTRRESDGTAASETASAAHAARPSVASSAYSLDLGSTDDVTLERELTETVSPTAEEIVDFNQRWQAIWPRIVAYFKEPPSDPDLVSERPDTIAILIALFKVEDINFTEEEQHHFSYANLREGQFIKAQEKLTLMETGLTEYEEAKAATVAVEAAHLEARVATTTSTSTAFVFSPIKPTVASSFNFFPSLYDLQYQNALKIILDAAAGMEDDHWQAIIRTLQEYFRWEIPEGVDALGIEHFASVTEANLIDPSQKDEAKEWLQTTATWAVEPAPTEASP